MRNHTSTATTSRCFLYRSMLSTHRAEMTSETAPTTRTTGTAAQSSTKFNLNNAKLNLRNVARRMEQLAKERSKSANARPRKVDIDLLTKIHQKGPFVSWAEFNRKTQSISLNDASRKRLKACCKLGPIESKQEEEIQIRNVAPLQRGRLTSDSRKVLGKSVHAKKNARFAKPAAAERPRSHKNPLDWDKVTPVVAEAVIGALHLKNKDVYGTFQPNSWVHLLPDPCLMKQVNREAFSELGRETRCYLLDFFKFKVCREIIRNEFGVLALPCPKCHHSSNEASLTGIDVPWNKAFNSHAPRVLHGVDGLHFYVSRRLKCFRCQHTFQSDQPEVLELLPRELLVLLPDVFLTHQNA